MHLTGSRAARMALQTCAQDSRAQSLRCVLRVLLQGHLHPAGRPPQRRTPTCTMFRDIVLKRFVRSYSRALCSLGCCPRGLFVSAFWMTILLCIMSSVVKKADVDGAPRGALEWGTTWSGQAELTACVISPWVVLHPSPSRGVLLIFLRCSLPTSQRQRGSVHRSCFQPH